MKKLLCIALSLFVLLSLSACGKEKSDQEKQSTQDTDTPLYELYYAHGSQFLTLTKEGLKAIMSPEAINKPYLTHSSVAEMKEMIESGNLPASKLRSLCRDDGEWKYTMKIFDTNNLYDVVLPTNEKLSYITWAGDCYYFHFDSESTVKSLICISETEYKLYWERNYEEGPDLTSDAVEIISDQLVSDRNARVIRYNLWDLQKDKIAREYMVITYQIAVEQDIRYIEETYMIGSYTDEGFVEGSSTVPTRIGFCGTSNGAYFIGSIMDPVERPSVQWFSEIGFQKFSGK